jgi:hypothetical protein
LEANTKSRDARRARGRYKGSRKLSPKTRPKISKDEFIAELWDDAPKLIALAVKRLRSEVDGHDLALDELAKVIDRIKNPKPGEPRIMLHRASVWEQLRKNVRTACTRYLQAQGKLKATRSAGSRRDAHDYPEMRRVVLGGSASTMPWQALNAPDTSSIWDELRVQYAPVYTREGPGPCNLCGRIVWWNPLNSSWNWDKRRGNPAPAPMLQKLEIIELGGLKRIPRHLNYRMLRPSVIRHRCSKMDPPREPRHEILLRPRQMKEKRKQKSKK